MVRSNSQNILLKMPASEQGEAASDPVPRHPRTFRQLADRFLSSYQADHLDRHKTRTTPIFRVLHIVECFRQC
jgi:hypothetical protein